MHKRFSSIAFIAALALAAIIVSACSSSTRREDEDEGCRFSYESDSGRPPMECLVPLDSEETCLDAARCFCSEWNPEASAEEIEQCAEWETYPRGMITLSDFCNPTTASSLTDALTMWIEGRGGTIFTEPECDEMPATLPYW